MTGSRDEVALQLLRERQRRHENSQRKYLDWKEEVTPRFSWRPKHLDLIRHHLERVYPLREIDRLMLFAPPRHSKSESTTIHWPAYVLEMDPFFRWIVAAYGKTLSDRFSRRTRAICQERIPLSDVRAAVDDWETIEGGGLRSIGVGSGVTGHGADGIFIDDPVRSRQDAESKTFRDRTYEWYKDDLSTRLEPDGFMVLMMTRWHEDDLAGRILASEEGKDWTVIRLPALAEEDDILGRKPGEALWPERYDESKLLRLKKRLGHSFGALFQGRPTSAEGGIVKKAWINRYSAIEDEILYTVQSLDCNNKDDVEADFSVLTTWAVTRLRIYLVAEWRKQVGYPELKKSVKAQALLHEPDYLLIEDKGNGTALLQELKDTTALPIVAVEPVGDKISRLAVQSVAYETGQVYHPTAEIAPWIKDFETELTTIPNAPKDDRGDSVSQAVAFIRRQGNGFTFQSLGSSLDLMGAPGSDTGGEIDLTHGFGRVRSGTNLEGF